MQPDEILAKAFPNPADTGIYFLIDGGVVTYIGKSENVAARITEHAKKGRPFDKFFMIHCRSEDLNALEAEYIRAYNPSGNKKVPSQSLSQYAFLTITGLEA
jgi:excinuclease UvrABC nuclease subunit